MGAPSNAYVNITDDTPVAITDARVLRRVVVGTGASSATVTITETDTNKSIAIIDAANPDVGRQFDVAVNGLVITCSDAALDVTVTYD